MASKNHAIPTIINPGFESAIPLEGWQTRGVLEPGGDQSQHCLTHPGGRGPIETTQVLKGLPNGWVTLKVHVRSSGIPREATIALKDCGGDASASVPIVPGEWLQVVVSAQVTRHCCTISLVSDADPGESVSFDNVQLVPGQAKLSVLGADISSLYKSESFGGTYADEDGTPGDALDILKTHGMNWARIRVWVDSPDGYHGKSQLLGMAKRLDQHGIKLLVDFHYADSWADPGKQPKPAAWNGLDFEGLKHALYEHTYDVCMGLKEQGTPPAMVQVGNEIPHGMVWPEGKNADGFENLAALLKEGYRAVKDCSPQTQVMLHIDRGGDNDLYRWWFDNILEQGVPFDLIGASYYPYWQGTFADLQNNLNDVALRYGKDIIVVETAYAFTGEDADNYENIIIDQECPGYPFTPSGQKKMLADIMMIVRAVPNGHGLGIMWWDATWTPVKGNGWDPADPTSGNNWENQALFDFEGRALPAMGCFNKP
jgi:arabinogalactan endo-1,4-beta-galactosidase